MTAAYLEINIKDGDDITRAMRFVDFGAGILGPMPVLHDSAGAELIGQKAKTLSLPIVPASDWPLLGSGIANPSANFTRPADTTPYASGDLVANNTTAGSVTPLTFAGSARFNLGAGKIPRVSLFKSTTGLTNAVFRLHLYTAAPTPANGDNAAWSTDGANYRGAFDVTMNRAFTDGAYGDGVPFNTEPIRFKLSSGSSLRGLIEARGAYTPGNAEVFTATLEIEQT